jgi:hypothetical protein
MAAFSTPATISLVPYLASPVILSTRARQRKRVLHNRSSMGWFSVTSAGVTNA